MRLLWQGPFALLWTGSALNAIGSWAAIIAIVSATAVAAGAAGVLTERRADSGSLKTVPAWQTGATHAER